MKLSVSLSDSDLATLDRYVDQAGARSRSAAIQQAIRLLPDPRLEAQYAEAAIEWEESGDAALWDTTVGDGLSE